MKARIPYLLVWLRLALATGFLLVYFARLSGWIAVIFLVTGIISDIFDGVLARRWHCATPHLRRMDSNVDTIFWGLAGTMGVITHASFLEPWRSGFLLMFALFLIQNVINGIHYRRQPSYHMWSGKLWSIALVIALISLFLGHPLAWTVSAVVALGIYNSIEGIIASLVLPTPMTDIPTVFHAIKLARKTNT